LALEEESLLLPDRVYRERAPFDSSLPDHVARRLAPRLEAEVGQELLHVVPPERAVGELEKVAH
jgi:hypothetical protein